jgi:hypothetical protein
MSDTALSTTVAPADDDTMQVPDMTTAVTSMHYKDLKAEIKEWGALEREEMLGLTIPSLKGDAGALKVKLGALRKEYTRLHSSQATAPVLQPPAAPTAAPAQNPPSTSPAAAAAAATSPAPPQPHFTGPAGGGFSAGDSPSPHDDAVGFEEEEEEEEEEAPSGTGAQPPAKKARRAKAFSSNEKARLCHVIADSEVQLAVAQLRHGRDRHSLDTGEDHWEDAMAKLFNSDTVFTPIDTQAGTRTSSPRFRTTSLDPNKKVEPRSGKQLKEQWTGMKKATDAYFRRWKASGEGNTSREERSISDFMDASAGKWRVSSERTGRWIKYMHLVFKVDEDLWAFAMKGLQASAQRESGAASPVADVHLQPNDRENAAGGGGGAGGRASPIDMAALGEVMQQSSASDTRAAAAMEEVARVMELNGLLQVLPSLPDGAMKAKLVLRVGVLMDAAPPPAAPAPPPAASSTPARAVATAAGSVGDSGAAGLAASSAAAAAATG